MANWLDVDQEALQGMLLALKKVDKDARKEWAKATRSTGTRVYRSALSKRTDTRQESKQYRRQPRVSLSMGGKGTLRVPTNDLSGYGPGYAGTRRGWAQIEFGSPAASTPRRNSSGHAAYGALKPFGSWFGQMMLKTTADLIRDAANLPRGA